MPTGNMERDLGRIEGALKAHEDRMDRTDKANAEVFAAFNVRLDGMDGKLDTLLDRSKIDDGANSVWQRLWTGGGNILLALIGGGAAAEAIDKIGKH